MVYDKISYIEDYELLSGAQLREAEHQMGRELLRSLLKANFGVTDYEIGIGEHGKPYLIGLPYHFSISHSHGIVACAVADVPVGVDIERVIPVDGARIKGLAKRFFTKGELEYILSAQDTARAFYCIWTRKESVSKCTGLPFLKMREYDASSESEKIQTRVSDTYVFSIAINI